MPLYEYQCDACGHRFEVIQKFSDLPVSTCPSCGGAVHKLQSAPAIQFKGSGFYITDYAKKDYTAATKADSLSGDAGSKESSKGGGKDGSKDASSAGSKEATSDKGVKSDAASTASAAAPASASASSTPSPTKSS